MIAHHVTATRPLDHRVGIFLLAMRSAKRWSSDNVTRTHLVAYVLQWVMSQVPTEKATAETESNNGCGVLPQVPAHAGYGEVYSRNCPCMLTTKLRWKVEQPVVQQTRPQSRVQTTENEDFVVR